MQSELTRVDYLTLENRHLFTPEKSYPAHTLTHGMLLVVEHLDTGDGELCSWICRHCLSAHDQNCLPGLTLANNMWIGPTPSALSMLTIPEQLLIALRYPRGYVFKLGPRGGRGTDHPATIQTTFKGNVTTYVANVDAVVQMLEGQLMPRTTGILSLLIAVTFIGLSSLAKSHLKSLFRVRRTVVHAALLALKHTTQHPGYVNLEIDKHILATLPEDEVPDEIIATIQREYDEAVIVQESAGYVPEEREGEQIYNMVRQEIHPECARHSPRRQYRYQRGGQAQS